MNETVNDNMKWKQVCAFSQIAEWVKGRALERNSRDLRQCKNLEWEVKISRYGGSDCETLQVVSF